MTPDKLMKLIDDYACEVANAPPAPTPIERKLATERIERARNAVVTELAKPAPTQPVQPSCWCARCDRESNTFQTRMAICPLCGDKRCPRAKDHRNECAKTTQPAWHDAPNAPGLWVSIDRYSQYDWHLFRAPMTYPLDQSWVDKSRYFGPIPLPEDMK